MSEHTEGHVSTENVPVDSFVQANLNYLVDRSQRLAIYTYEPPPGTPKMTGQFEPRPVLIRNARLGEEPSLDRTGGDFGSFASKPRCMTFTIARK
jgi:hypothetical protein